MATEVRWRRWGSSGDRGGVVASVNKSDNIDKTLSCGARAVPYRARIPQLFEFCPPKEICLPACVRVAERDALFPLQLSAYGRWGV